MEGYSRKWLMQRGEEINHGTSEEKKLELRLGPPNGDWSSEKDETLFPFSYISKANNVTHQAQKFSSFLQLQSTAQNQFLMEQESSQAGCTKTVDVQSAEEKKAFSQTATVLNSAQKRTAPSPVVGWPPIRSFRKNLACSSSVKPANESQNVVPNKSANEKPIEICQKGLFVKINMDGIPIGRKVDLNAYDSYDKLSSAVDQLFRGLLAAQNVSAGGNEKEEEEEKAIRGLLDGSGEYTLVYEDNEGDRMLVGDVPWHMFVSTVKRLRVLKSSDLSTLTRGTKQQD